MLPVALTVAISAGACADPDDVEDETPSASATTPIVASALEADLAAAGIDTKDPPTWDALAQQVWVPAESAGEKELLAAATPVMELFTKSLGVACEDCHSLPYYGIPPEVQRVVTGMWDHWVHGSRFQDGKFLFCDSCHQGKKEFLVRDDVELATWMQDNFVAKLEHADGQVNNCASCHGEPFQPDFLSAWAAGN
ncbi:cytochrome c3 family protein [Sorangium sp. So ce118]